MTSKHPRKPFYANEMHNDSFFSVHTYFTHTQTLSGLREFVDVPRSFGVDNTYKYLRRGKLDKLPYVTETNRPKKRLSVGANNVTLENYTRLRTPGKELRTMESAYEIRKSEFLLKVCIYEDIGEVKSFWDNCIEIDLMRYLRSCFLKCKLQLETLTVEEFRTIERLILPTLRNTRKKLRDLESPIVLLGILEMKNKHDLFDKIKRLQAEGKDRETAQLIQHFFIPDEEVMDHQLKAMLQEINRVHRFKKIIETNQITRLFLMDGTPVECLFQLSTGNPIVLGAPEGVDSSTLNKLRESLRMEIREEEKVMRSNWIKSVVRADRVVKPLHLPRGKSTSYEEVESRLKRRQRAQTKTSGKDARSILNAKESFLSKDQLVREYDIFY